MPPGSVKGTAGHAGAGKVRQNICAAGTVRDRASSKGGGRFGSRRGGRRPIPGGRVAVSGCGGGAEPPRPAGGAGILLVFLGAPPPARRGGRERGLARKTQGPPGGRSRRRHRPRSPMSAPPTALPRPYNPPVPRRVSDRYEAPELFGPAPHTPDAKRDIIVSPRWRHWSS